MKEALDVFKFKLPDWVNGDKKAETPQEKLDRAHDVAQAFYALGIQTGIHSMIEWCGVMTEYVKMLKYAYDTHGIPPDEVDKHSGTAVDLPIYMVEYFCEKLGCQLIPFIKGDYETKWEKQFLGWISEGYKYEEKEELTDSQGE